MGSIDPQNLFKFLEEHDEYPASGQRLADEARETEAPADVVKFFEDIPVTLESESDVVEHAMKPDEPPYGTTLDMSSRAPEPAQDEATLEIADIVSDEPAHKA